MTRKQRAPIPSPLEAAQTLYVLLIIEKNCSYSEAFSRTLDMLLRRYPELTPLQAKLVVRKASEGV